MLTHIIEISIRFTGMGVLSIPSDAYHFKVNQRKLLKIDLVVDWLRSTVGSRSHGFKTQERR